MELDELKSAWQVLDQRLRRNDALQFELLREHKLDQVRKGLRPLYFGQTVQFLLGIGLIALGVACWSRNPDVPGLLATGIVLHAFGVLTAVMAGLTMGLARSVDYATPVVAIQKQMARLLKFHTLNANLCGAPWWIMWVLVVAGFAGLGEVDPGAGTPAWISISLAVGVAGMFATWAYFGFRRGGGDGSANCADGGDGIRRSRRLLAEVARFEQE